MSSPDAYSSRQITQVEALEPLTVCLKRSKSQPIQFAAPKSTKVLENNDAHEINQVLAVKARIDFAMRYHSICEPFL